MTTTSSTLSGINQPPAKSNPFIEKHQATLDAELARAFAAIEAKLSSPDPTEHELDSIRASLGDSFVAARTAFQAISTKGPEKKQARLKLIAARMIRNGFNQRYPAPSSPRKPGGGKSRRTTATARPGPTPELVARLEAVRAVTLANVADPARVDRAKAKAAAAGAKGELAQFRKLARAELNRAVTPEQLDAAANLLIDARLTIEAFERVHDVGTSEAFKQGADRAASIAPLRAKIGEATDRDTRIAARGAVKAEIEKVRQELREVRKSAQVAFDEIPKDAAIEVREKARADLETAQAVIRGFNQTVQKHNRAVQHQQHQLSAAEAIEPVEIQSLINELPSLRAAVTAATEKKVKKEAQSTLKQQVVAIRAQFNFARTQARAALDAVPKDDLEARADARSTLDSIKAELQAFNASKPMQPLATDPSCPLSGSNIKQSGDCHEKEQPQKVVSKPAAQQLPPIDPVAEAKGQELASSVAPLRVEVAEAVEKEDRAAAQATLKTKVQAIRVELQENRKIARAALDQIPKDASSDAREQARADLELAKGTIRAFNQALQVQRNGESTADTDAGKSGWVVVDSDGENDEASDRQTVLDDDRLAPLLMAIEGIEPGSGTDEALAKLQSEIEQAQIELTAEGQEESSLSALDNTLQGTDESVSKHGKKQAKNKVKVLRRKFKTLRKALKKAHKQGRKASRKAAKSKAVSEDEPQQDRIFGTACDPMVPRSQHGPSESCEITKIPDLPSPPQSPQWTMTSMQLVATFNNELKECWSSLIDADSTTAAVEARSSLDKLISSILNRLDTRQQALQQLSSAMVDSRSGKGTGRLATTDAAMNDAAADLKAAAEHLSQYREVMMIKVAGPGFK